MTFSLSKHLRVTPRHGAGPKAADGDRKRPRGKRRVRFADAPARRHEYDFDGDSSSGYWYSEAEMRIIEQLLFDEVGALATERGVRSPEPHAADGLSDHGRALLVGDEVTRALDVDDDDRDVSLRGIEHYVFPLLQEEMVRSVEEVRSVVLRHSRNRLRRRLDPRGIKLAEESKRHSKWSRDFAIERGIKYCEVKGGLGHGGGLLQISKSFKSERRSVILGDKKPDQ